MKFFFTTISLITLTMFLSGCIRQQESIIEKSSCELPCWNEINVGKTTSADALKIASSFDQSIKFNGPSKYFEDTIKFAVDYNKKTGYAAAFVQLSILQDTVSRMDLIAGLDLSIQDLIDQFGEPETVHIGLISGNNLQILLIIPTQKIAFYIRTDINNEQSFEIQPESRISILTIYSLDGYDDATIEDILTNGMFDVQSYPWVGYGNLREKYSR